MTQTAMHMLSDELVALELQEELFNNPDLSPFRNRAFSDSHENINNTSVNINPSPDPINRNNLFGDHHNVTDLNNFGTNSSNNCDFDDSYADDFISDLTMQRLGLEQDMLVQGLQNSPGAVTNLDHEQSIDNFQDSATHQPTPHISYLTGEDSASHIQMQNEIGYNYSDEELARQFQNIGLLDFTNMRQNQEESNPNLSSGEQDRHIQCDISHYNTDEVLARQLQDGLSHIIISEDLLRQTQDGFSHISTDIDFARQLQDEDGHNLTDEELARQLQDEVRHNYPYEDQTRLSQDEMGPGFSDEELARQLQDEISHGLTDEDIARRIQNEVPIFSDEELARQLQGEVRGDEEIAARLQNETPNLSDEEFARQLQHESHGLTDEDLARQIQDELHHEFTDETIGRQGNLNEQQSLHGNVVTDEAVAWHLQNSERCEADEELAKQVGVFNSV